MSKIKVYLDNCCYNRPYDDQDQLRVFLETQAKLQIQNYISTKKLGLVISYISEFENSKNPHESRRDTISDFFKNAEIFVDKSNFDLVGEKSIEIMKTGIREMDALHVAAAIIGKADYFITTDIRLLKYQTNEIIMINPIDFIRNVEV